MKQSLVTYMTNNTVLSNSHILRENARTAIKKSMMKAPNFSDTKIQENPISSLASTGQLALLDCVPTPTTVLDDLYAFMAFKTVLISFVYEKNSRFCSSSIAVF